MRKKNGIFILGTQTEAIALSYEAEIIKKKKVYKDGENVEQHIIHCIHKFKLMVGILH